MARTKAIATAPGEPTEQVALSAAEETARDAEEATYAVDKAANRYKGLRQQDYPTIGDQLDMLWHAIDTGNWTAAKVKTTDFYAELKAVKADNPKPEGA